MIRDTLPVGECFHSMKESERIAEQLRRAWEGEAWHGPPLKEILAGVTAQQAAARPVGGAHAIWEIVLHITRGRLRC